ncbi:MAG: GNAT family N-acetyltransferase [Bacilli bacterium]|nr:GNAT family N-acetyltransferase [Bacilli bacterium]
MLKIEILNVNNINEYSNFINYLKKCSWESVAEYLTETLENNELTDSEKVIVAYLNGEIVGFAALVNESVAESFNGTPYLDHLFVDEAHRNKGIATKLVDKIIELAKENNKVLYLVTVSHELFYKKLGFETIAKSTVIDCIDECFIMKKNI